MDWHKNDSLRVRLLGEKEERRRKDQEENAAGDPW